MNNYKKITPYMVVLGAGILAFSSLTGCKSLDTKVVEEPVAIEEILEEPLEPEPVVEEPVVVEEVVEPEPVEPVVEVVAVEPVKSLEEKVVEAPVVVPTTSNIILDYIRALEPNVNNLYSTLSPRAQAFGLGLVDGLADEIDGLDVGYQSLAKEAGDYLVKTGDVVGLITEAERRLEEAPETEQEQITNWTDNLKQKLDNYVNSNPEAAQEFYEGLNEYANNLEESVKEKFIRLYD